MLFDAPTEIFQTPFAKSKAMRGGDVLGEASKINKTEREGPGAGQDDGLPGDLRRHK